MAEVARIDSMTDNAKQREERRETIYHGKQDLNGDDAIYDTLEQLLGEDGMLLHELGKVVKAGGW